MHPFYIIVGQGGLRPPVQVEGKMHTDCWIQQVTTRVGAVTCWIQQSVSPKQVVGFTCVFNSEIDQLIRKFIVLSSLGPPLLRPKFHLLGIAHHFADLLYLPPVSAFLRLKLHL